jgi:signal transduction histidine kinase
VDVDLADAVAAAACTVHLDVEVDASDLSPHARVDARRLDQILTNLLSNAGKYGAPPIEVRIEPLDDQVRVAVSDHGPGVPAEFVPQLFERFTQANAGSRRSANGFGLGLAISAELAGLNDATLTYEPPPGGGATFVLLLPAASRTEGNVLTGRSARGGSG